jgi:hypothetical protein
MGLVSSGLRALTVEPTGRPVELLHVRPRAAELDLVNWVLATGARIGEALTLRSSHAA